LFCHDLRDLTAVFPFAGPGVTSFRATRGDNLAAPGDNDKRTYTSND